MVKTVDPGHFVADTVNEGRRLIAQMDASANNANANGSNSGSGATTTTATDQVVVTVETTANGTTRITTSTNPPNSPDSNAQQPPGSDHRENGAETNLANQSPRATKTTTTAKMEDDGMFTCAGLLGVLAGLVAIAVVILVAILAVLVVGLLGAALLVCVVIFIAGSFIEMVLEFILFPVLAVKFLAVSCARQCCPCATKKSPPRSPRRASPAYETV